MQIEVAAYMLVTRSRHSHISSTQNLKLLLDSLTFRVHTFQPVETVRTYYVNMSFVCSFLKKDNKPQMKMKFYCLYVYLLYISDLLWSVYSVVLNVTVYRHTLRHMSSR